MSGCDRSAPQGLARKQQGSAEDPQASSIAIWLKSSYIFFSVILHHFELYSIVNTLW